ncbi:MAG: hypothetical protein K5888_03500 [Lachnospiraceae bacterium]|nr:hypothetical protein [Lachnospiraceae bacterium]
MSKIEKLIKKFFEKPVRNDMTMDEIIKLSRYYGCEIVTGGNHQIKIVHRATGTIIPMPQHGKNVKEAYVVELRQLFDVIISKKG